jgi:hypothetical protein
MEREKYFGWTSIELAEAMVGRVPEFKDRDPQDLASKWDRSDMMKELVWAE